MRLLIDMGHPAHVHLFKYFIQCMLKEGHEIKVTARDKEVTKDLLSAYGIPFEPVGKAATSQLGLLNEWLMRGKDILKIARNFNPDILLGVLNPVIAHAARRLGKRSIILTDTEHATIGNWTTLPFADSILTPSCYPKDLGMKHVRYNGYHELAYLHPNHFSPDSSVLDQIGLLKDERIILLRFVSWNAHHDNGQTGIRNKLSMIKTLEDHGRVIVSSEKPMGKQFDPYLITLPPERLHDLLYYTTLYIGEGATIASECAVLGTHALYVNTLQASVQQEEEKYGLVYNFNSARTTENDVLQLAERLLTSDSLFSEGKRKAKALINDKIDVNKFFVDFVQQYEI